MTKINFTGNIQDVKEKIEQTVATYELLGSQGSINFATWFEAWEQGFPEYVQNRPLGNFALSGENQWRLKAENRPRWREWVSDEQKKNGIITGEYWRDRANESTSVVLSGTALQLIQHIVQLEYTGKGGATEQTNEIVGGGEVKRKGKPQLCFFFKEDEKDLEPGYAPVESKITVRLMGQSETTISKANLNQYKNKIKTVFGAQGGRIWRRGKDYANYTDWENGYQLQLLVRSKAEGELLVKDFLAIQNIEYRSEKYFYNENQNPSTAYPTNPGKQTVLGKSINKARQRPIAELKFQWASLLLGGVTQPIYLLDLSGTKQVLFDE